MRFFRLKCAFTPRTGLRRLPFRGFTAATTMAATGLLIAMVVQTSAQNSLSQRGARRQERLSHRGGLEDEGPADTRFRGNDETSRRGDPTAHEAPTGFDNKTNGFDEQGPDYDSIDEESVVPLRSFNDNRFIFEEFETIEDGLGPVYNAQSCRECHQNVVTGGASQVAEHRTGHMENGEFFESLGGSLIHSRATHPDINELVAFQDDISTFRISTNTLGAGFVEAIANSTLLAIRDAQPAEMRGTAIMVPILEAANAARIGRFGWKDQHASLESFAADAYLNEMGITTPVLPEENSSGGRDVVEFDTVADPEDDGVDVKAFANFMRATKAPSRGPTTPDVTARRKPVRAGGLRRLPYPIHYDGAGGNEVERRLLRGASSSREQDHSSVQRLSPARHRNRRWDPGVACDRVCGNGRADADGAVVGAADP